MAEWPQAIFVKDRQATRETAERIFAPGQEMDWHTFHLLFKGTNFQVQVWQALLTIPPGSMVNCQDVVEHIDRPGFDDQVARMKSTIT